LSTHGDRSWSRLSLDDRIVNQFALFSLMAGKQAAAGRLDRWLARRPRVLRRVVIPRALLLEVRDKLDQANVTELVLLQGVGRVVSVAHPPTRQPAAPAPALT
jgi:hypothetical protein